MVPSNADDLSLYHFESCPYCIRVRNVARRLGVELELRDIQREARHRQDLQAARGRTTVPVLRISQPQGDLWMPESADIISYLEGRFGKR